MSEAVSNAEEQPEHTLRVLLVDDHDLFRSGLRTLLEEQGVLLLGEVCSGV